MAGVLERLDYDPDFTRPRPIDTPERWLIQRLATTHGIHHMVIHNMVSGFATLAEGENGDLAITAVQIGFPAFVILNIAAAFGSFRFQPERHALMSQAIARGMAMGLASAPFCVQRWEEGWERPLADWRRGRGLQDSLGDEPCTLRRQLADRAVDL